MDNILTDTPREKELETRDEHFLAEVKDKRVAVLLSGGVDSSVVLLYQDWSGRDGGMGLFL